MKNFSANLLISIYTLAPLLTTKVMAKEYEPYGGCDPTASDGCKLQGPGFDLFHPFQSLFDWVIFIILSIIEAMTQVGTDIFSKTNGEWNYAPIGTFIDFFGLLSLTMLGLGVALAIAEMAISYSNGQGNIGGSVINIVKAAAFALMFTTVMTTLFSATLDFGTAIMEHGLSFGGADAVWSDVRNGGYGTLATIITGVVVKWLAGAGMFSGLSTTVVTIGIPVLIFVLVFVVISAFKFGLMLAKRCVVFMTLLAEGSLLPFSMARGYAGNFQSFLQKSMTFMLSCILQVWFFGMGFYFISIAPTETHWIGIFITGWAFIECADKVFSYMGTVGGEGASPITGGFRSAMGAVNTFTHLCAHNDLHGTAHPNVNEGEAGKTAAGNTGGYNK